MNRDDDADDDGGDGDDDETESSDPTPCTPPQEWRKCGRGRVGERRVGSGDETESCQAPRRATLQVSGAVVTLDNG